MVNQRQPRVRDPGYLKFLHTKPCCLCGGEKIDAAHIRSGSIEYDKRKTGFGERPDDRWTVPLCRSCHASQHGKNEMAFWNSRGIGPFALARKYYAEYQAAGGGKTTTKKPKPKPFPKSTRKIQSRGFR